MLSQSDITANFNISVKNCSRFIFFIGHGHAGKSQQGTRDQCVGITFIVADNLNTLMIGEKIKSLAQVTDMKGDNITLKALQTFKGLWIHGK